MMATMVAPTTNTQTEDDPIPPELPPTRQESDDNTTLKKKSVRVDQSRCITMEKLELLNILFHPVWVFDYFERRMRWANKSALELWNAADVPELQARDFSDLSEASAKRLEEMLLVCAKGKHVEDQWTLYPKGKATSVQLCFSVIRLEPDEHVCMMVEGFPLTLKEKVDKDSLRGVEMLRHLPMPVCQFSMEGKIMFSNPEGGILKSTTPSEDEEGKLDDSSGCLDDDDEEEEEEEEVGMEEQEAALAEAAARAQSEVFLSNMEENNQRLSVGSSNRRRSLQRTLSISDVTRCDNDPSIEHRRLSRTLSDSSHNVYWGRRSSITGSNRSQGPTNRTLALCSSPEMEPNSRIPTETKTAPTIRSSEVPIIIDQELKSPDNSERNNNQSNGQNFWVKRTFSGSKSLENDSKYVINALSNDSCHSQSSTQKMNASAQRKQKRRGRLSNRTRHQRSSVKLQKAILRRNKQAGDFVSRFVDVDVGYQVLEDIQTKDAVDLEALVHSRQGPKWSRVQVRKSKDPVTGDSVILYSAQDKSDAIEAKKERQAREQKSEFLAIMAHEIRTPLHQVTGFIDLLDQTNLDPEQKSFVKLLKESAQGLMTVISDVLDYSKLEAGRMKLELIPYEPRSVIEGSMEAVRTSCEEKNLYLKMEWHKDIPFKLLGDPNRLRQVLLNLLSNAVKFTKKGGIRVQAFPVKPSGSSSKCNTSKSPVRKNCNSSSTKQTIKFVVKDTGIGVGEKQKAIIFRKYQQANASVARHFGGTGLGLSICQLLVKMMGGSIGVESNPSGGASFWFQVPADVPEEQPEQEEKEYCPVHEATTLNILVVEDNKVNQKLLANMLRRMGHESAIAENGKVAIEMVAKACKGGSKQYDLLLMDIQMPVMDGLEATRRLRSMGFTNLPIYGLTASVSRSDFVELGFNDWLPKPTPMKDLKAKLYQLKRMPDLKEETKQ